MVERRRVKGRFVREDGGAEGKKGPAALRAPRASHCRTFVRKRIAEAMPELIGTLIEKAREGSYQHMSLLARLAGLHVRESGKERSKRPRRGSSVVAKLMKELLNGKAKDSENREQ